MVSSWTLLAALSSLASTALATCPGAPAPAHPFRTAQGWEAMPVLGNLSRPRGIVMDKEGHLLVLERGLGITGHRLDDNGCVTSSKTIVADPNLNHGIDVDSSGDKLYASTPDVAYEWSYDADDMEVRDRQTLITGMLGPGQNTRTLLVSRRDPKYLIVSVGSGANIDESAFQVSEGRAQVRVFDTNSISSQGTGFTDSSAGRVMGYGLRNAVGLAEDKEGTIHAIENSVDDAYRVNVVTGQVLDIHENNPADKMYTLGRPQSPNETFFAGAPYCYTVWDPSAITDLTLRPGDYFALQPNSSFNDGWCATTAARPALILPPHTAPLDMKFGVHDDDNNLYIGLHGSYNRDIPIGYKVLVIPGQYSSGRWQPSVDLASTANAQAEIFANQDEAQCGTSCFRPVGLTFNDDGDHLYVSSDTTGEVFLLRRGSGALGGFKNHPPASITTIALLIPAAIWLLTSL